MSVLPRSIYLLSWSIVCGACGVDRGVDRSVGPIPLEREILSAFRLLPDSATIEEGEEFHLGILIRYRDGVTRVSPNISYSTRSPLIAGVRSGGAVIGIASGTAVISARTTVGHSTYTDSAMITVRPPTVLADLVLQAESYGWAPSPAHVKAGGKVEWRGGLIAAAGIEVKRIYLLAPNYGIVDSLELVGGKATRNFSSPGIIRYCSNACWDPPEFGMIHVH